MIINPYIFGIPYTGLFDTYVSPTLGFSMFRLDAEYTGYCMRVRRTSDNTTLDIGFVDNYLDTASLLSFVGASDGRVVKWYDQSGNGNDLTQTVDATAQPQIVSSGSLLTRNGITIIKATSAQSLSLTTNITGTANRSWWFSYEKDTAGNQAILGLNGGSYMYLDYGTQQLVGDADFVVIPSALSINTFRLISWTYVPNLYKMYDNNSLIGSNVGTTDTMTLSKVPMTLFRTTTVFFNELLYWQTDQTANRSAIELDINTRNLIYTPPALNTSLYAVYKAESNANDSLGGYNGLAYGGLTYSAGKSGNAFIFNGSDAYVELASNAMYLSTTFSLSFWAYCTGSDANTVISNFDNSTGNKGFYIDTTTSNTLQYRFVPYNSSNVGVLATANTISLNTWNNIIITVNGTSSKIYVNGTLNNSLTLSNTISFFNGCKPIIGAFRATNTGARSSYKNMKLDELYIYNKELTSTEATTLYNSGTGKFYPTF